MTPRHAAAAGRAVPVVPAGAPHRPGTAVAGLVARSVLARPWLVPEAALEATRMAPPGWWRRRPFLPLPDAALWRFRMETAYGGAGDAVPPPEDVRAFLRWCAGMRRWRK